MRPRNDSRRGAEKRLVLALRSIALALPLLVSVRASAQPAHRWAVVAASASSEPGDAVALAEHLRAALVAQGEPAIEVARVAVRIDATFGSAFGPAPPELVDEVRRVSEVVLEHVAFGRLDAAYAAGDPTLDAIERAAVAVGRTDAALDAFNLCLYLVRADVAGGTRERAAERATRCARLAPATDPDPRLHPAGVREIFGAVRGAADAGGGVLSVTAAPDDPEGCAIRLNGHVVGRTPRARIALPAGAYGVQVECAEGAPGRVLEVAVDGQSPVRVTVAARTTDRLSVNAGLPLLRYVDADALAEDLATDIGVIQQALEVDRVLVAVSADGVLEARAFESAGDRSARVVGSAQVARPVDDASSRSALASMRGSRVDRAREVDGGLVAAGVGLLGAGVATLAAGWYFWSEVDARAAALDAAQGPLAFGERQRELDASRVPVLALGAVGSLVTSAGAVILSAGSVEDDMPWWSWVIGAIGLGTAGVGIGIAASEGACHGTIEAMEPCARRTPTWVLGTLVVEHAAPLLAVPITYAIRAATSSATATARVSVSGWGATLEVGGAL